MYRQDLEIGTLIQVEEGYIKRGEIPSSYKGIWEVIKLTYFQVFVKNQETGIVESLSNHQLYHYWEVHRERSKNFDNKTS